MAYNKVIIYGRNFELYKYEREPGLFRSERKSTAINVSSGLRDDGTSVLGLRTTWSESKKVKRKDNTIRAQLAFRRLVAHNLQGCQNPLFITLTYRKNQREISEGFRDFTSFTQSLRYKFGLSFKYICVPEFQKRGAVHFHALFWGVSKELLGVQRDWPDNAIDCYYWDYGFVFVKNTDGHIRIANYLSKYMAKAFQDPRLSNQKAYCGSRNLLRPYSDSVSDFALSYVMEDWLGVENFPIVKRHYMTQYLGSCDYQRYIIK